jgi:hypothetical protein
MGASSYIHTYTHPPPCTIQLFIRVAKHLNVLKALPNVSQHFLNYYEQISSIPIPHITEHRWGKNIGLNKT